MIRGFGLGHSATRGRCGMQQPHFGLAYNKSHAPFSVGTGHIWVYACGVARPAGRMAAELRTRPRSIVRFSMSTALLFCSQTISQKCPHVLGKGPW